VCVNCVPGAIAAAAAMQRAWTSNAGAFDAAEDMLEAARRASAETPGWDEQRATAATGPTTQEQRVQYTLLPWADPQAVHALVDTRIARHVCSAAHLPFVCLFIRQQHRCRVKACAVCRQPLCRMA
jgi:hypothetical protein